VVGCQRGEGSTDGRRRCENGYGGGLDGIGSHDNWQEKDQMAMQRRGGKGRFNECQERAVGGGSEASMMWAGRSLICLDDTDWPAPPPRQSTSNECLPSLAPLARWLRIAWFPRLRWLDWPRKPPFQTGPVLGCASSLPRGGNQDAAPVGLQWYVPAALAGTGQHILVVRPMAPQCAILFLILGARR
jgi:hypothetical protein